MNNLETIILGITEEAIKVVNEFEFNSSTVKTSSYNSKNNLYQSYRGYINMLYNYYKGKTDEGIIINEMKKKFIITMMFNKNNRVLLTRNRRSMGYLSTIVGGCLLGDTIISNDYDTIKICADSSLIAIGI